MNWSNRRPLARTDDTVHNDSSIGGHKKSEEKHPAHEKNKFKNGRRTAKDERRTAKVCGVSSSPYTRGKDGVEERCQEKRDKEEKEKRRNK